jgi:hypothetical protein
VLGLSLLLEDLVSNAHSSPVPDPADAAVAKLANHAAAGTGDDGVASRTALMLTVQRTVGWALFLMTSLINFHYAHLEVCELRSLGLRQYASSMYNYFDVASFFNVLVLAPLLATGHDEAARALGAIGTVLMLPKILNAARGDIRCATHHTKRTAA